MTRRDYRQLLEQQGIIGCRCLWFDDGYVARLPYAAIDDLYVACQFNSGE